MENDLVYDGEKISILGLELFYSREKIESIFTNMNDHMKMDNRHSGITYCLSFRFWKDKAISYGIKAAGINSC